MPAFLGSLSKQRATPDRATRPTLKARSCVFVGRSGTQTARRFSRRAKPGMIFFALDHAPNQNNHHLIKRERW